MQSRISRIEQIEASKSKIKDLVNDFLNEAKDFKYQITLKVIFKKYRPNGEIGFTPVYFSSTTKTVISLKFSLENDFQEIMYRIDNWINVESGSIIKSVESQYINISIYRLLSEGSYVQSACSIKKSQKKNN